ncbi:MAG: T9SS type A sorting domain-containing protein [Saprospiraceae bacterium]|nr:T9SS type A sorting domain-containing protein [Candidatus Vicinibacter affinis]
MKKLAGYLLIFLFQLTIQIGHTQSYPPADDCLGGPIYPSLASLIGSLSPTTYSNPNGPNPLCPGSGVPVNTGWYSFAAQGGQVNFVLTFSNCNVNGSGVQIGIYRNCDFSNPLICPNQCYSNGTISFGLSLDFCEVYNLFINGCNGDVCDVQLSATGAIGSCSIIYFEPINYDLDHNLETCINSDSEFFVDGGYKKDKFEWTIDNVIIPGDKHQIKYNFSQIGDYEICVSRYRISAGGIRYAQSNRDCSNVHVFFIEDQIGADRTLCYEQTYPKPFIWHGNIISEDGEYRASIITPAGCKYDSIVRFIVLPKPEPKKIYHIGTTPNNYYVNPQGISIKDCTKPYEYGYIVPGACKQFLEVHQFIPNFKGRLEPICLNDNKLYYQPLIENNSCHGDEEAFLVYTYYLKDLLNPKAPIIKSDEFLEVKGKSTYSFYMDVDVYFGPEFKRIRYELGIDSIDESRYLPDGGKDIQTKNLFVNLNASTTSPGSWKFKSGPGMLDFDQINDPKTRITVNKRGIYYVEWITQFQNCSYADEVKVNVGSFYAEPGQKKARSSNEEESSSYIISPDTEIGFLNLKTGSGNIRYTWIDLSGKLLDQNSVVNQNTIVSPSHPGMYFLRLEQNESVKIIRVLVAN